MALAVPLTPVMKRPCAHDEEPLPKDAKKEEVAAEIPAPAISASLEEKRKALLDKSKQKISTHAKAKTRKYAAVQKQVRRKRTYFVFPRRKSAH